MPLYDGDSIEHKGRTYRVQVEHDDDTTPPWQRSEGHGPVSDWTRSPKAAGEWVLCEDRGSFRYYDARQAQRLAKADGWRCAADIGRTDLSRGELAARAVAADFDYLRRWCADQWHYVGLIVTAMDDDGELLPQHSASLWGLQDDDAPYLETVAHELADDAGHDWPRDDDAE